MNETRIKIDLSAPALACCAFAFFCALLNLGIMTLIYSEVRELDRGHRSVVQFLQSKVQQPAKQKPSAE